MSAFWAVVKKEISAVLRERTIIIAILIQLFIASFSSALLIGMLSLYDADSIGVYKNINVRVGLVTGAAAGDLSASEPLPSYLSERGLKVQPFATLAEAKTAFYQGKLNAIISAPVSQDNAVELRLFLPQSETTSSLLLMIMQEPLKRYENYVREQRGVEVRYTDLQGKPPTSFEFIYSVIIPVLMFFPAFVAGSMVIDSLSEEVENNTLQTLLSAPLTPSRIVGAKITAALIVSIVQCAAWLALLHLNKIVIHNWGLVLVLATTVAGLTTVGAGLVETLFKDRERSQFVYSLGLLAAASISFLLNLSPIKTLSRLAIGDYYTSAWDVLVFLLVLAVMTFVMLRSARRLAYV